MKYIYIILAILSLSSCDKFLGVNPDKSGSATIYHMDQLYGLMGNPTLYNNPDFLWMETIYLTDDVTIDPYYLKRMNNRTSSLMGNWDKKFAEEELGSSWSWGSAYRYMFDFNVVLENIDIVEQTTLQIKEQVRGEALFGRAYFHFHLLVMYSKYDLEAPGIGYKDNTDPPPSGIPARNTVKYTLDMIDKDLVAAEAALKAAGKTEFDHKRSFRITLPALYAFKARFELYRGNYDKALLAANDALKGHGTLLDFKNDPLYVVTNPKNVDILDADGNKVGLLPLYEMTALKGEGDMGVTEYVELYIPHWSRSKGEIPMSESLYDLFDRDNDERWKRFYNNNYCIVQNPTISGKGFNYVDQQNIKEWARHTYLRFIGGWSLPSRTIGPTTGEMYLIKAECLSRAGNVGEAQQTLQTLRQTRFTTVEAANNIEGTVQDVLDERRRELTSIFRWYDLKRLNGKEGANISVTRSRFSDLEDFDSSIIEGVLEPNDPRYAFPIPYGELLLMGWEQN